MKDEVHVSFLRGQGGIRTAVALWCRDPAAAKAQYGPIASWDTSEITIRRWLFQRRAEFNGDISRWDTSRVRNMEFMFYGVR